MDWSDDDERVYRASRFCRVLGNPKTYEIVRALAKLGPASPSDLKAVLDRSYGTICIHLRHLREIDVARCMKIKKGNRTVYALANPETGGVLDEIESLFFPPEKKPKTAKKSPGKKTGSKPSRTRSPRGAG